MARPKIVIKSPMLRYADVSPTASKLHLINGVWLKLLLDREIVPNQDGGDMLCVSLATDENDDAYYMFEVKGHPDGLPIFVAPNFNPNPPEEAPEPPAVVEIAKGVYGFESTGIRPENYFGKYVASVEEALETIVGWTQSPGSVPKEYQLPAYG